MDIRPEYRKKSIRSYVVRAGRMTEAQRKAYEVSWPTYGLKLANGVRSMLGNGCAKCAHRLSRIQHVIPLKQAFNRGGANAERP